jgi:hypothetical protein
VATQTFHVILQHSAVAQTNPILLSVAFPQPSKDHATINGITAKEAHLFDIEGIEYPIHFENNPDGVTIFWQDLPKGVYYLNMKDQAKLMHRAKIMVSP